MAIREFEVTIGGNRLMMHNDRLSDPLDPHSKALRAATSSKDKKTDEGQLAIARAEFEGGLYFDKEAGPYVPDKWINSMLVEGARRRKLGRIFEAHVTVRDEIHPLQYQGPRTIDGLWKAGTQFVDRRSVGNQQNRVMRTRAIFRDWKVTFLVRLLDDSAVNKEDVEMAIEDAAPYGLGDGRPMYAGKFVVVEFKEIKGKKAA